MRNFLAHISNLIFRRLSLQHFRFRQLRKINVGNAVAAPAARLSLLCVADQFGLVFVGTRGGEWRRQGVSGGGHLRGRGQACSTCAVRGFMVKFTSVWLPPFLDCYRCAGGWGGGTSPGGL